MYCCDSPNIYNVVWEKLAQHPPRNIPKPYKNQSGHDQDWELSSLLNDSIFHPLAGPLLGS